MTKISNQIQINIPKNKVWEIVSDFGSVANWSPIITKSALRGSTNYGVGAEDVCEILGAKNVHRKAVEWDEGNMINAEVRGIPPAISMFNKFLLSGEGDQTVVTFEVEVEFAGTEAEKRDLEDLFQRSFQLHVQGLKQYAETGQKMIAPVGY